MKPLSTPVWDNRSPFYPHLNSDVPTNGQSREFDIRARQGIFAGEGKHDFIFTDGRGGLLERQTQISDHRDKSCKNRSNSVMEFAWSRNR